jgi:hypothetical protein
MPDVTVEIDDWVIEVYPTAALVEVDHASIEIVETAVQGLPGAPGVGGSVGYTHTQSTLSTAWTINHNLHRKPSITVIFEGGTIEGTPIHNSDDVAVVTFAIAISGSAYCI